MITPFCWLLMGESVTMVFMRGSIIKQQSHTSTEVNRAKQKARYSYPAIKTVISPHVKEKHYNQMPSCPSLPWSNSSFQTGGVYRAFLSYWSCVWNEHMLLFQQNTNPCFTSPELYTLFCFQPPATNVTLLLYQFWVVFSVRTNESTLFYTICMEFQMFSFPSHLPKIGQYLDW